MNIPISIHPLFWVLALLLGMLMSGYSVPGTLVMMGVILFSLLFHEYGHALTAVAFGQNASIHLGGFGGVTRRSGARLSLWKEFIIVLNGPLASILLCVITYFTLVMLPEGRQTALIETLNIVLWINIFWTVFNLLPVLPLDGGRLISILLEALFGLRGVKISLFLSLLLCIGFGLLFFAFQAIFPGAVMMLLAFENYRSWKGMMEMSEQDQDAGLWEELRTAEDLAHTGQFEKAMTMLVQVREAAPHGVINVHAAQQMSDLYFKQGKLQEAYDALWSQREKLTPQYSQALQAYAYQLGRYKEAIGIGNQLHEVSPNYQIALMNALAHAGLHEVRPTVGWLRTAVHEGLPNPKAILSKEEFSGFRQDPEFQDLIHSL